MVLVNLSAEQQWRCRHRQQTHGHGGVGRKERVGQMETAAWEHYTTICKMDSQWEFAE